MNYFRSIIRISPVFLLLSCSGNVEPRNEEGKSRECKLQFSKNVHGELLLLTSMRLEGSDQIGVFKDRCSPEYGYVFFDSGSYQILEKIFDDALEQPRHEIKAVVLDARVHSIKSSEFDAPVYLVSGIYGAEPIQPGQLDIIIGRNNTGILGAGSTGDNILN